MFGRISSRALTIASVAAIVAACSAKDTNDDAALATASASQAGAAMDTASVEYAIVFRSSWTRARHPFEYPAAGVVTGPHFSGIIGAAHNASYSLFADGTLPTAGLEKLSEEGKHAPLDEEIRTAIAGGNASHLFESGPLRDFADSVVTTVRVDPAHPFVSLVAMIAPSPDWFTGATNVNLMENGQWAASRTLELQAWDSGGDDGATYKAADKDLNPKKPIALSRSRHFVTNGRNVPVASVTFVRK
jgi:hypothetical protein